MNRWVLAILAGLVLILGVTALAQDDLRVLVPDTPVTGTLDSENVAQVYTFAGTEGQSVTLEASTSIGFGLALLLTDSAGLTIAQDFNPSGAVVLADVPLPADDTYYVTVFSALGVTLPAGSTFELTLTTTDAAEAATEAPDAADAEPTATPEVEVVDATPTVETPARVFAPGEILTATGFEIALTWNSTANMDLEVRDPVGGSVWFVNPEVPSGGVFDVNVNSACGCVTDQNPTERVRWPAGAIPTGSYEVLVYYQPIPDCPTTEPVTFSVVALLEGQVVDTIEGTIDPNEVYLASFVVEPDGSLLAGADGLYTDFTVLPPVPVADLLADPLPIAFDQPLEGLITSDNYWQTYVFQASADQLVTIDLQATSGSLDTLFLLLDSSGRLIDANDDRAAGVTDSLLQNRRLNAAGTYYILATRYGKEVGGTEGNYILTLSGPTADLPQEVIDLGLDRGLIEVSLTWNTAADLRLLVRDPRGATVFVDVPEVDSGGVLGAGGNIACRQTAASPLAYTYWPQNRLPGGNIVPGLYEVEIIYVNNCNDTRPLTFELNIFVNGEPIFADTRTARLDEWYVTSFFIGASRQVETAGPGGFIGTRQQLDSSVINYQGLIASAQPIANGQTLTGSITREDKYQLYSFEGQAGDVVTIDMARTSGQLDTKLFLIDPAGFQVAFNDDITPGEITDSRIAEFTLPQDGRYIIIATHFGMEYGGTIGTYNLTFSRLN